MGVDSHLYVSKRWNVSDIRDILTKRMGLKVTTRFHDFALDYVILHFEVEEGEYRSLNVHSDTNVGGFPAMLLSFRSNEQGIKILRKIAETTGGIFQEEDCSGDMQEIQPPDEGNASFVVKECLKANPRCGDDEKVLAVMLTEGSWK